MHRMLMRDNSITTVRGPRQWTKRQIVLLITVKNIQNYKKIFLAFNWPVARHISRSFEVIGTNTVRTAPYDFLVVIMKTMGLPRTVSVTKKTMIAIFFLSVNLMFPPTRIPLGISLRQWAPKKCNDAVIRSTEKVWRSVTSLIDSQTDRWTDGRTDGLAITISRCAWLHAKTWW